MSAILGPSDYILEVLNLYYTGHVEPPTWVKQLTGTTRSGLILRDVSFEVHSGEMMAILGSKGSGKKALLDVVGCRANGPKKGYVLLNGVTLNKRLFNAAGSYVSGVSDEHLLRGLTVGQTLEYEAALSLRTSSSVRSVRVRQILSEVALTQVAGSSVESLTPPEIRRLALAVQLIKDPVVLLADEPAWNLDPLNTYFVVSILSNYAKKYGRIVVVTMEKPRSDIFPFLDRVSYLCLGDVVYSGNTRVMLDYFRNIGFPCPEVENPLMYYLCLATVDRRSEEKFVESNNQIRLLVDKFKLEGGSLRKGGISESRGSVTPLHALGRPSPLTKFGTLIVRSYIRTFAISWRGLGSLFFKVLLLPLLFFFMWIFYFGVENRYQHSYVSHNGFVLNTLAVTYFSAIWSTIATFDDERRRYYTESRSGTYNGPLFITAATAWSLPLTILTVFIGSRIAFECSGLKDNGEWGLLFCILLAAYLLGQQQTFGAMATVKSRLSLASLLVTFHAITLILASGTVRSLRGLPEPIYYFTYLTQHRFTGGFLNEQNFLRFEQPLVPYGNNGSSCTTTGFGSGCRYINGSHYLEERYYTGNARDDLGIYMNLGLAFTFPVGNFLINLLIYALPLPLLVKQKFRD